MQMLSVANCCPPIECRQPETEIGKPFRDAECTISASSSLVRGLSSSRTRVRLSWEWTSLTQIFGSAKKRRRAYEFAPRQHGGSLVEQVKSQPGKLPRLWRLVHRPGRAPVRADYRD